MEPCDREESEKKRGNQLYTCNRKLIDLNDNQSTEGTKVEESKHSGSEWKEVQGVIQWNENMNKQ